MRHKFLLTGVLSLAVLVSSILFANLNVNAYDTQPIYEKTSVSESSCAATIMSEKGRASTFDERVKCIEDRSNAARLAPFIIALILISIVVGAITVAIRKSKDKRISKLKTSPVLFKVGGAILLAAPFVWYALWYFLTLDCPRRFDGALQCSLGKSFGTLDILVATVALWVFIGIYILVAGLLQYLNAKKNKKS